MFENVKGVKVEGANFEMDENQVSLRYVLRFEDLSAFNTESYQFSFVEAGNEKNFHVFIKGGGTQKNMAQGPLREKVLSEAVNQAMSIYKIKITVVFPAPIVKSNAQEVQGRTATWIIPVWDLQKSNGFDLDAKIKIRRGIWERIKDIF